MGQVLHLKLAEPDQGGLSDLSTLVALAQRHYRHGMVEQAATLMRFVLRHEPAEAAHHLLLGKALHANRQHAQALEAYLRAVRLGLNEADLHLYIGQCLIYLRQYGMAEEALAVSLRLGTGSASSVSPRLIEPARLLLERVRALRQRPEGPQKAQADVSTTAGELS